MFHQFDQGTCQVGRVDKCDASSAPTDTRELVDEASSPGRKVSQSLVDIEHGISNVVETLTLPFEESPDRRVG